jgi:hypothetical protein
MQDQKLLLLLQLQAQRMVRMLLSLPRCCTIPIELLLISYFLTSTHDEVVVTAAAATVACRTVG